MDAARRLFAEGGFAQTSLRAIALAAGVSEQTIYASFGRKSAIVRALIEEMDVQAAGGDGPTVLARTGEPRKQLRMMAEFERRLFERDGEIIALLREASRSDPDLEGIYQAARERARKIHSSVITSWHDRGDLRSALAVEEATDIYGALASLDVYRLLVEERAWSPDRYEAWLYESLEKLLLDQS